MTTQLANVVIDANDIRSLARFWAGALGWLLFDHHPDAVNVSPTEDRAFALTFLPVPERKTTKNRLHLDLSSQSANHQTETVDRLLGNGATHVDIGQGDVPWVVLGDPEGNEFCVLPPRHEHADTGPLGAICIDAADANAMADFWSAATGWPVVMRGTYAALHAGTGPFITLGPPVAPKHGKNRIHVDVWPDSGDQGAEVERLIALGARRADVGQGDAPFVVMADPEDNEFCVLPSG